MSDDKRNPGRADRNRIKVNEDYELRDWSKKFGVSKEELVAAVKRVGPMVRDVEVALKKAPGENG
jgi:predicted transcriptional regulator